MHHQDFSGDPPAAGSRKTAYHYRRGSSGASASNPGDDNNPTQAGSSSPGLHHHQQQQQSQASGAQVKKKSGFQITSVTSAQINVSGNNSLADDTESYDDMDESHTEDLSSSDILDVSVSRATDTGVPERSSSDETLNSLHGVDTPGLVSPNEPLQLQGSQQQASLVNGTVHHHYYPHHQHSDSLGGGEPALPALPIATSSPAMPSKAGGSQAQKLPTLDNSKPAAAEGGVNISNMSPAADNTNMSGQITAVGGGTSAALPPPAAPAAVSAAAPNTQTQAATGSRFRVVKLDTNSEPFRKGRWTCTEYYEKEVPPPAAAEAPKGAEVAAEAEAVHKRCRARHSRQAAPLAYVSPQEVVMQKPVAPLALPQPGVSQPPSVMPYTVEAQPQGGYPAPQLHSGVRQPDFIQPTAPFQTQVQPPLPHVTTGLPITPLPGVTAQQPQLPHQSQVAPPALPAHPQPLPTASVPHGTPYMPLTAVLQPLLTPGATFAQVPGGGGSIKTSQLEDAQKLLLQHQGLLSLPRLAGNGAAEAHAGMSAEASAFMAAAAGLRTQHGDGEEDRARCAAVNGRGSMNSQCYTVAMDLGVCQLRNFSISFLSSVLGKESASVRVDNSSSGASVVAIDNKIEQAMDLVKSHLMYAVREEVEVLKEQIKELIERNTQLEQENNLLKNLASPEQMAQFQAQVQTGTSPTGGSQPPLVPPPSATSTQALPSTQSSGTSA
ncbi:TSC22 domain family protein 1 [Nibea albiflora]|uniref:TSC22 domain family protein 1 n=1 Tax=Nibea albiflora TaxID=240163 RepID=A0ACB7ERP6_NIBAL|nr:TSC22 domain family protein 1 [Nibea albiflora]